VSAENRKSPRESSRGDLNFRDIVDDFSFVAQVARVLPCVAGAGLRARYRFAVAPRGTFAIMIRVIHATNAAG
jgi:hypothetical protein